MTIVQLICARIGKQQIFVVDIDRHQVVAELKEEIGLMACIFGALPSREIDLFLAKQHGRRDNPWLEINNELAQIQQFAVSKAVKATYMKKALLLNPLRQVGWYFPDLPESGVVHVLVRFPHNTYPSMKSINLAFTPNASCLANHRTWKDKVAQECHGLGLLTCGFEARSNTLRSVECLDSPGADDLAHRQKMAVAREFETKLSRGEKLLGPAWLLDQYFAGVPRRYAYVYLVTTYPPGHHIHREKIASGPYRWLQLARELGSARPPRPLPGPMPVSWWRWPRRSEPQDSKRHLLGLHPSSKR